MIFQSLLFAVVLASPMQDAPRVTARLSSTNVAVGEMVVLQVSVERATDAVDIGALRLPPGLVLAGRQDFTQTQISIPGGRTLTRRRDHTLQAAAPGRYRIPPVDVRIGNRTYRTNAVEIVVTGVAQPRSIQSGTSAWLNATMYPDTVYVGQQSTLRIEAGFSEEVRVRLTRPPVFEAPSPTGFWVQDVPGGVRSQLRNVDGRIVEIQSMQKAYFPLASGRYAFAPARALIDVREGFLFAPETREIRSESPRLTVLPLPDAGKPADFKGAVGQYAIRALLQPDTVTVGEAVQVTVEVTGIGNIKAVPPPALPAIPGVEMFAPTEEANVQFDGATVRGTKRFQWVMIPDRTGTIEIPAAVFSFFDPVARSYKTIRSMPLTLFVNASSGAADDGGTAAALHALRPQPDHASLQWVRTRAFVIAQGIPLLFVLAALLFARARKARSKSPSLPAELKRIKDAKAPYSEFLKDLEALLRSALREEGGNESVRARVGALIHRIEVQRFAPSGVESVEREALLNEAETLLKEMVRSKPAGKTHASVLLVMLALLQAPGANEPFAQGREQYRSGQFAQAARSFDRVIAADSLDVSAWVNLGNAHYRAGDRGRAIWAWTRAAQHAPRDRDIVRNLQAAGAIEVLRTRPPLSVRPVEWYFLAALGWWLACALAVVAIARGKNTLLSWALAPIALMVIALTVGVLADGRKHVVALNEQTRLHGDPTIHSPVVRNVQAGAGLDILEDRGNWLRVRTFAGSEGWVESDKVGKI